VLEMEQRASSPWRVVGTRSTTSMFVRHHWASPLPTLDCTTIVK
jgi:hypothetical protein